MRKRSASLSNSDSESESESESEAESDSENENENKNKFAWQGQAIPPMDAEVEDIFTSVGLGAADENMDDDDMDGYSESGDDSDTEEVLHNSCSGIQDLLLTGEVR
jgi:hypothetical protein